jgi:hypothetical protein
VINAVLNQANGKETSASKHPLIQTVITLIADCVALNIHKNIIVSCEVSFKLSSEKQQYTA